VFLCNGQDFYDFSDAGDQGPPNWGDATLVIDANDLCINGDEQSPINIDTDDVDDQDEDPVEVREFGFSAEIDFNTEGNNLEILIPAALQSQRLKGGPLEFDDDDTDDTDAYNLLRLEFHRPCMHLIDDRLCDLEVLYFFERDDQDFNNDGLADLAIVSVQYNTPSDDDGDDDDFDDDVPDDDNDDDGENSFLVEISEAALGLKPAAIDGIFRPFDGFPEDDRSYFAYTGSIPNPPCTEDVDWIVFSEQQEISRNQILEFTSSIPSFINDRKDGNTRDVADNSDDRDVIFVRVVDDDYFF
jgi:carbonic anhydrase